jgi:hypothetical protein
MYMWYLFLYFSNIDIDVLVAVESRSYIHLEIDGIDFCHQT